MDLTLLITTHNRAELLRRSLERLCFLTLPAELIVVDDGGTDDTEAVCADFADGLPMRYLYNDNPGPSICSMARNIGVKEAKHEWIVTSEPELIFRTDVLRQFADLQPDHPDEVISAGRVWFLPGGFEVAMTSLLDGGDFQPPDGTHSAIGWVAPHTALWKREWIEAVGGWDETFPGPWGWDDTDLLTRLRISGHGQHIAPGVEAYHQFHGLGADQGQLNERHFLRKSFNRDENDQTDVVANREREWGILTPKT